MQAKTIGIILKIIEIIAGIFISTKSSKGGNKNDGTRSSKKK